MAFKNTDEMVKVIVVDVDKMYVLIDVEKMKELVRENKNKNLYNYADIIYARIRCAIMNNNMREVLEYLED